MSFTSELFGGRIRFTQYLAEGKPGLWGSRGSRSPSESPTQIGCSQEEGTQSAFGCHTKPRR